MQNGTVETVTIAEAAALLGVHRNTVRNRIKAGRYKAYKLVTPQGETYAVERDSLDLLPHNAADKASQAQVRYNLANGSKPGGLTGGLQQEQQLVVVQRLLAPFVEDLAKTHAELGRVQERLAVTERERDELRAERDTDRGLADQLVALLQEERDAARAELDRLRAVADAPAAPPEPRGETGTGAAPFAPSVAAWRERTTREVDLDAPAAPIPWWRRWLRRVTDG